MTAPLTFATAIVVTMLALFSAAILVGTRPSPEPTHSVQCVWFDGTSMSELFRAEGATIVDGRVEGRTEGNGRFVYIIPANALCRGVVEENN